MIKKLTLIALASMLTLSMPTEISYAEHDKPTEIRNIVIEPQAPLEPQLISFGEFLISAYCSCEICCEEYAIDRPVDENGKEIVTGSIGEVLTPQYSIAVYPKQIPYRTEVIFNGNTYLAQDCGGAIKQNRIDLYFDSHQEALEWGMQYHEIFLTNEKIGIKTFTELL